MEKNLKKLTTFENPSVFSKLDTDHNSPRTENSILGPFTKQLAIYDILEPIVHYLKCITESIFWSFESSAVWRWKGRYAKKCNVSHTSLCSRTCKQRLQGEIFSVEKFKIDWYACGHIWTGRNCHVGKSQGLKSNTLWRNSRLVTFFFLEELQIDQISNYHSLQYHFSVFCRKHSKGWLNIFIFSATMRKKPMFKVTQVQSYINHTSW